VAYWSVPVDGWRWSETPSGLASLATDSRPRPVKGEREGGEIVADLCRDPDVGQSRHVVIADDAVESVALSSLQIGLGGLAGRHRDPDAFARERGLGEGRKSKAP